MAGRRRRPRFERTLGLRLGGDQVEFDAPWIDQDLEPGFPGLDQGSRALCVFRELLEGNSFPHKQTLEQAQTIRTFAFGRPWTGASTGFFASQ